MARLLLHLKAQNPNYRDRVC